MEIKDLIKSRRLELGLTILDVAKAVGVSESTVSRWESGGIINMRRDRMNNLAKILQISPLDLLDSALWGSAQQQSLATSAEAPTNKERLLNFIRDVDNEDLLWDLDAAINARLRELRNK